MSNAKEIAKIIKKSEKIVLFHHVNPDGDSLSSSYGLMKAIQAKFPNKEVKWVANVDYIKKNFSFLINDFSDVIEEVDNSYTAIIGDNAIKERIYDYEKYEKAGIKVCFDHHRNKIDFEFDSYWQDYTLGASSVQAYDIASKLKVPFNDHIALSMIFGILTDTFNFTYSLNDTRPVKAAMELMKHIKTESMDNMYKEYRKRTKDDVAFQAYALSNFKIDSGIAYLKITDATQKRLKLSTHQVKRVNLIGNIEGIHVWIFFIEDKKNNTINTSMRSLGFPVNEVSKVFGGGGHLRASGIKLDRNWKEIDKVILEIKKQLKVYLKAKKQNEK
ncbi:MAG: bifunctional oligoribonuclease/PAP phosphatase NrnA [Mycoplasmatales bacterium]|nr:bifunctional oligoribonuclease/PAP phosphatase NrnA [Mycoplasmatales bacterium]